MDNLCTKNESYCNTRLDSERSEKYDFSRVSRFPVVNNNLSETNQRSSGRSVVCYCFDVDNNMYSHVLTHNKQGVDTGVKDSKAPRIFGKPFRVQFRNDPVRLDRKQGRRY